MNWWILTPYQQTRPLYCNRKKGKLVSRIRYNLDVKRFVQRVQESSAFAKMGVVWYSRAFDQCDGRTSRFGAAPRITKSHISASPTWKFSSNKKSYLYSNQWWSHEIDAALLSAPKVFCAQPTHNALFPSTQPVCYPLGILRAYSQQAVRCESSAGIVNGLPTRTFSCTWDIYSRVCSFRLNCHKNSWWTKRVSNDNARMAASVFENSEAFCTCWWKISFTWYLHRGNWWTTNIRPHRLKEMAIAQRNDWSRFAALLIHTGSHKHRG